MNHIILVCGGRGRAPDWFNGALDSFHAANPITRIIHGDAIGVDRAAGAWARLRGVECLTWPADWGRLGHRAGPVRNARMLAEGRPDAVLGFPGGVGTAHMLALARAAGVLTLEIRP